MQLSRTYTLRALASLGEQTAGGSYASRFDERVRLGLESLRREPALTNDFSYPEVQRMANTLDFGLMTLLLSSTEIINIRLMEKSLEYLSAVGYGKVQSQFSPFAIMVGEVMMVFSQLLRAKSTAKAADGVPNDTMDDRLHFELQVFTDLIYDFDVLFSAKVVGFSKWWCTQRTQYVALPLALYDDILNGQLPITVDLFVMRCREDALRGYVVATLAANSQYGYVARNDIQITAFCVAHAILMQLPGANAYCEDGEVRDGFLKKMLEMNHVYIVAALVCTFRKDGGRYFLLDRTTLDERRRDAHAFDYLFSKLPDHNVTLWDPRLEQTAKLLFDYGFPMSQAVARKIARANPQFGDTIGVGAALGRFMRPAGQYLIDYALPNDFETKWPAVSLASYYGVAAPISMKSAPYPSVALVNRMKQTFAERSIVPPYMVMRTKGATQMLTFMYYPLNKGFVSFHLGKLDERVALFSVPTMPFVDVSKLDPKMLTQMGDIVCTSTMVDHVTRVCEWAYWITLHFWMSGAQVPKLLDDV